jgi:hypothetical protein
MTTKNNNKKSKKFSLPTSVEIFKGMRSEVAVAAFQRSGAGFHADRRDRKVVKKQWRNEEW